MIVTALDTLSPEATGLSGDDVTCSLPERGAPPLFIEAHPGRFADMSEVVEWVRANRETLDGLVLEHGGIVLRQFPIASVADFDQLAGVFPNFVGKAVADQAGRTVVSGRVIEATRIDRRLRIPIHSEKAYMRDYPPRVAFFCRTAAPSGGATTIADLRAVSRDLPESVRDKVARLGVCHVRSYGPPLLQHNAVVDDTDDVPWNIALGTDDRDEAEQICRDLGHDVQWHPDGAMTLTIVVSGIVTHPRTGQAIYRSSLHTAGRGYGGRKEGRNGDRPTTTTLLGDGSQLTVAEADAVNALIDEHTISWPWRSGDLMILDNLQVGHGREPYEGHREVLVSMLG